MANKPPIIDAWTGRYKRARILGQGTFQWITLGSLRKLVSLCEDMDEAAVVTVSGLTKSSSNESEHYLSQMFVREEEADR